MTDTTLPYGRFANNLQMEELTKMHRRQPIIALSIIFLTTALFSTAADAEPELERHSSLPVPTIEVTGRGIGFLAPDMATVRVGVTREAHTAREAIDQANTAMYKVIKSLTGSGIAKKDLRTENFSIRPRYRSSKMYSSGNNTTPAIIGYTVSNTLMITIRDLKGLGTILDTVVSLGVNTGGNIQFANSDPSSALKQARTRALQNALAKAETLTRAAGVQLGKILSITENTGQQSSPPIFAETLQVKGRRNAVPLAAGENVYRVLVRVRWAIIQ